MVKSGSEQDRRALILQQDAAPLSQAKGKGSRPASRTGHLVFRALCSSASARNRVSLPSSRVAFSQKMAQMILLYWCDRLRPSLNCMKMVRDCRKSDKGANEASVEHLSCLGKSVKGIDRGEEAHSVEAALCDSCDDRLGWTGRSRKHQFPSRKCHLTLQTLCDCADAATLFRRNRGFNPSTFSALPLVLTITLSVCDV